MPICKILGFRFSYWTKGYNKGKINVLLDTDKNRTLLIENLTPAHGSFLLDLLRSPGILTCDPDNPEGLIHLNSSQITQE